jgi:hypothetical protein
VYAARCFIFPEPEAPTMKTGMTGKTGTALLILSATLAAAGCEKKDEGPKPCCTQVDIPPGVAKFSRRR